MIQTQSRFHIVFGGAAGYIAFAFLLLLVASFIHQNYQLVPIRPITEDREPVIREGRPIITLPSDSPQNAIQQEPRIRPTDPIPRFEEYADDIAVLAGRRLLFPLQGMPRNSMKKTFMDPRGGGRLHEGVDILAPRNTPVVAIEDGKIGRLWNSKYGGITIYQFDPSATYIYYYAHLEKYASNLKEGQSVRRGQVIGYVGTSGNAPKNTPHLHFGIYRAAKAGQWHDGKPLDPYPVFP
jgi:murein DD-endopeptidase MepM/ murein hydrolase activator NlpD